MVSQSYDNPEIREARGHEYELRVKREQKESKVKKVGEDQRSEDHHRCKQGRRRGPRGGYRSIDRTKRTHAGLTTILLAFRADLTGTLVL